MKKIFKIVATLLLVLVTSTFVFAQTSNTFTATAGTLRDDADNFMDVRYYNDVDFSNFFAWTNLSLGDVNLGFAKKFNELYLGAYYAGDLLNSLTKTESKEISSEEIVSYTKNETGMHEFDLLFGFSGMALKLNTNFNINSTYTSETNYVKNSNYIFDLTWGGLSVPVENFALRPYASIGYAFTDASTYTEDDTTPGIVTKTTDKSGNLGLLTVSLGSDLEWGDKSGFFSVAGLTYALSFATGLNGEIRETVTSIDGGSTNTIITKRDGASNVVNIIAPYYRFEYTASEKVKFGGCVNAVLGINSLCNGFPYIDTPSTETPTVITTSTIASTVALGMQYKLKENFAMNVGFGANLPSIFSVKNVDAVNNTRTVVANTVVGDVDTLFSSFLRTGFVWDINENCALDASMSIGTTPKFLDDILNGELSLGFKYKI